METSFLLKLKKSYLLLKGQHKELYCDLWDMLDYVFLTCAEAITTTGVSQFVG